MMDRKQRNELMDKLLVYANHEVERFGNTIKFVTFDFEESGDDAIKFIRKENITYEKLVLALHTCLSRGYFTFSSMSNKQYSPLHLTEEGQGRAISVEEEETAPESPGNSGDIHIGTLNASGPTQIGHYNTQQIESVFKAIVEKIDNADAADEQKKEAKDCLRQFLAHPLTSAAIGLAPPAIKAILGG